MYVPEPFQLTDHDAMHDVISANPLGALVTHGDRGFDACHIPFHLDRTAGNMGHLLGHVARANPVWQNRNEPQKVLVLFQAGNAYVSPNWYPSKARHHRQVPTWNYVTVHAHGTLTVHDDAAWLRRTLSQLTKAHESRQPSPWKMGDAPRDYLDEQIGQVVGLEIAITRLQGAAKLNQNKSDKDMRNVAEMMEANGNPEMARAMRTQGKR